MFVSVFSNGDSWLHKWRAHLISISGSSRHSTSKPLPTLLPCSRCLHSGFILNSSPNFTTSFLLQISPGKCGGKEGIGTGFVWFVCSENLRQFLTLYCAYSSLSLNPKWVMRPGHRTNVIFHFRITRKNWIYIFNRKFILFMYLTI